MPPNTRENFMGFSDRRRREHNFLGPYFRITFDASYRKGVPGGTDLKEKKHKRSNNPYVKKLHREQPS